ncbi:MAG TPA: C39 family peptidase [Polyangia bacterium]|nr:C39 family peptidase [Polyangia bacterium]
MSRIRRESFIDQFQSAGGLDAAALGADASAALEKAGIGAADLHALAGANGKIDTHAELGRLFDLLDRVDHDGHYRSIETRTSGSNDPTVSGGAYDALAKDLATARLRPPAQTAGARSSNEAMPSPREVETSLAKTAAAGFSEVHLAPVKYRNQGRGDFASHPYPTSPAQPGAVRTIHSAGCAPCALAMADSALRGSPTRPETTADFSVRRGFSGRPGGAGTETSGLTKAWASERGDGFTATANLDILAAKIRAGGVALVSVGVDAANGKGHFTDRSHVIVVNGVAKKDGDDWFAVADPGREDQRHQRTGVLGTDLSVVQIPGASNGCGRVWISRAQLQKEMNRCFILEKGAQS